MMVDSRPFLVLLRRYPLFLQRTELRLGPLQLLLQLQHPPLLRGDRSQDGGPVILLRLQGQGGPDGRRLASRRLRKGSHGTRGRDVTGVGGGWGGGRAGRGDVDGEVQREAFLMASSCVGTSRKRRSLELMLLTLLFLVVGVGVVVVIVVVTMVEVGPGVHDGKNEE